LRQRPEFRFASPTQPDAVRRNVLVTPLGGVT
jgi:hypothetical protein